MASVAWGLLTLIAGMLFMSAIADAIVPWDSELQTIKTPIWIAGASAAAYFAGYVVTGNHTVSEWKMGLALALAFSLFGSVLFPHPIGVLGFAAGLTALPAIMAGALHRARLRQRVAKALAASAAVAAVVLAAAASGASIFLSLELEALRASAPDWSELDEHDGGIEGSSPP